MLPNFFSLPWGWVEGGLPMTLGDANPGAHVVDTCRDPRLLLPRLPNKAEGPNMKEAWSET